MIREIIQDKLDVLLVSETEVDPSFPSSQFAIEGFSSPFRLDKNSSGGGIMLFIRDETPSKLLTILEGSIGSLAASGLFHMFTQSVKFYTFYYHVLKSTDV